MVRLLFIAIIFLVVIQTKAQQSNVRDRLSNIIKYTEVKVSQDSLDQWVGWVETGESTAASVNERNAAWASFLRSFFRHLGTRPSPTMNEQVLQSWSAFLTFPFLTGRLLDFEQLGREYIPDEEIISQSGNGPKHLLLIPSFGLNATLFDEFKKLYAEEFTFHEVSFPAGNNSWKHPSPASYDKAAWLTNVEKAIRRHINQLGNQELTVVTLGSGTYTGLKLAKAFPQIKSIIAINGQYRSSVINPDTGEDSSLKYRQSVAARSFPTTMFIRLSQGAIARNFSFAKPPQINQQYLNQLTAENANTIFRYNQELAAQDITKEIEGLQTPILSIVSKHDDQSVLAGSRSTLRSWQELRLAEPQLNLSLVTIPESRNLPFIDQPVLFSHYLDQFLENPENQVESLIPDSRLTVPAPSPLASENQVIETTKINITYSQPARNGRKVFGELVPYNQVWRAGANAATTLEVTKDVLINDEHLLQKGCYSLFFEPGEAAWEVIINQVPDQWGAFNYRSFYDALRFKVVPSKVEMEEFLSYDIQRTGPDEAVMSMKWEETEISFKFREYFSLPVPPIALVNAPWQHLLSDGSGDGINPGLTDGKALSYHQKSDTLWFRFDLHQYNNRKAFALNVLLDSDNDQSTGTRWFGTNTDFFFDKALTLWMQKSGNGFQGINGIMLPQDFTTGNQNLKYMNNLKYYLDMERKLYIVGVPLKDLELESDTIRVIGAVGEFQTWNDDIGDKESAIIKLKKR